MAAETAPNNSKLYVGNLPWSFDDAGLRSAFEEVGFSVVDARVVTDRETGRSRGFGFVTYGSDTDAASAMDAMNGKEYNGRPLRVSVAAARQERPGGGGGGGFGGERRGFGAFGGRDREGGGGYGGGRGGYGGGRGRGGYGGGRGGGGYGGDRQERSYGGDRQEGGGRDRSRSRERNY